MKFWKMFKFNIGCWIVASVMILFFYALLSGLWMFITSLTLSVIGTYLVAAVIILLAMTTLEYILP